jgi:hypothetical protein
MLTATPDAGSIFGGWSGGGCTGTGQCVMNMNANKTVTALPPPIPERRKAAQVEALRMRAQFR